MNASWTVTAEDVTLKRHFEGGIEMCKKWPKWIIGKNCCSSTTSNLIKKEHEPKNVDN